MDNFGFNGTLLRIVECFKHLGTCVDCLGVSPANTQIRTKPALSAYAPLAFKFFGSALISDALRLNFFSSLVVSRLFFNAHISVLTSTTIRRLNAVYMRGLRKNVVT